MTVKKHLTMENRFLKIILSGSKPAITFIANKLTDETYHTSSTEFSLLTDRGDFKSSGKLTAIEEGKNRIGYVLEYPGVIITEHFELKEDCHFIEKWIVIKNTSDHALRIRAISQDISFNTCFEDIIEYSTFGNLYQDRVPVGFIGRDRKGGIFYLLECPFFSMTKAGNCMIISQEPGIILGQGEEFINERTALGVYQLEMEEFIPDYPKKGMMNWPLPWHDVNPSRTHLDWGEIRSLQNLTSIVMPRLSNTINVALNPFCSNITGFPNSDTLPKMLRFMDGYEKLGVNLIGLPFPFQDDHVGYEVRRNPDEIESMKMLVDAARKKNIRVAGFVVPTSIDWGHTVRRTDKWQVMEADGSLGDNCLAHNEYRDWLLQALIDTTEAFGLNGWGFDFVVFETCFSQEHSHLPGEGSRYQAYRNLEYILRSLRQKYAGITLAGFMGTMSSAPWSVKEFNYVHQYYDHSRPVCAPFPSIRGDIRTADNFRLGSFLKSALSFVPPYRIYSAVGSYIGEEPTKTIDRQALEYSFLSSIGTGPETTMFHYYPKHDKFSPKAISFCRKWLKWTLKNEKYLLHRRELFGEPRLDGIDGYSYILGNRGFVFLFNPNHYTIKQSVSLDKKIGLERKGQYLLNELYPEESIVSFRKKMVFNYGDKVEIRIQAESVKVLEISPNIKTRTPAKSDKAGQRTDVQYCELLDWKFSRRALKLPNDNYLAGALTSCFALPEGLRDQLQAQYRPDHELIEQDPWIDESRLLIVIPLRNPDRSKTFRVYLNGQKLAVKRLLKNTSSKFDEEWINLNDQTTESMVMPSNTICFFVDGSSAAKYGAENELIIVTNGFEPGMFHGCYLENCRPIL